MKIRNNLSLLRVVLLLLTSHIADEDRTFIRVVVGGLMFERFVHDDEIGRRSHLDTPSIEQNEIQHVPEYVCKERQMGRRSRAGDARRARYAVPNGAWPPPTAAAGRPGDGVGVVGRRRRGG